MIPSAYPLPSYSHQPVEQANKYPFGRHLQWPHQMASTPRESTTTLPQPPRPLHIPSTSSPFHTPTEPHRSVPGDNPASPTSKDLHKPSEPVTPKSFISPKIELTGSAAMEENRRHDEELKKHEAAKLTSPNPAKSLFSSSNENISRPSDAPAPLPPPPVAAAQSITAATTRPSEATSPFTSHEPRPVVAEPMEIDEPESNARITSSPERTVSTNGKSEASYSSGSKKRPASPNTTKSEDRSNKSYTYPPPPDHDSLGGGSRNMSLPNSGVRSPSVKKHKCPHCDTEFTRHHNLKSHLLTHSHEKPYGCDQCPQRFRRLHDLKRHLKLHTGERPHTCNICGRKFARGDALARHNKGPGGCAGRRESGGGDDDYSDLRGDEEMEDAYPPDDEDGDENDPDSDARDRRRSEPKKRHRRSSARRDSAHAEYRQPSTYPPVAPALGGTRDMPPPTSGPPSRDAQHLSPWHAPPAFSSVQYNGPSSSSSMYSQSGMTESPKPLSPGNPDPHRKNSDANPRSPSLTSKFQAQHFGRSTDSSRTPPISLPPPVSSHQQLPGISGIDPRFSSSSASQSTPGSSTSRPPTISTQLGSSSSGAKSESSQYQANNGSNARDLHYLGQNSQTSRQDENSARDYARHLEMRLHEERTARDERDKVIRQQQDELNALRNEIDHLRSLQQQDQQEQQTQQHRRSH